MNISKLKQSLLVFLFMVFCTSETALALDLVVKKTTSIHAGPTKSSLSIGSVDVGKTLVAEKRVGMFWLVIHDGKEAYVSVLAVAAAPSTKLIDKIRPDIDTPNSQDNARSRSTVMGVRGLTEEDDVANAAGVRPNMRSILRMERPLNLTPSIKKLNDAVTTEIERKANGSF